MQRVTEVTMSETSAILSGIRVLDVGTFIFGPAATTVLADFGADVIKIEPPGFGDPYRYLYLMPPLPRTDVNDPWLCVARNKRSVALNLKEPDAQAVLEQLVAGADVLVTNYHPSVQAALGMTYEHLAAVNPRLIYAHATGYGEKGAEVEKPGYDATAWWARSGLMDVVRDGEADPAMSMPGMGDHPSAMTLFGGIMLALFRRERTGQGAKVSSSLMANGVWSNAFIAQAVLCGVSGFQRVSRLTTSNALANRYRTRDGRWLFLAMVQENKDWPRLPPAIGRPELAEDSRFATAEARHANSTALIHILDDVFASDDLAAWRETLDRHDITFGIVTEIGELADDPQMRANELFASVPAPGGGEASVIDSPLWLSGERKVRSRAAPEIGEHTDEVLASLGYGVEAIRALRERGVIG
jgi:crotonobetainyl-CoA:carnitine CoA-transferase CaiB-like acyl-CoA transferase